MTVPDAGTPPPPPRMRSLRRGCAAYAATRASTFAIAFFGLMR
jgi:hypothetical protein